MTAILGVSAFYHDSAAALVVDGDIVAAAQEERFTRTKGDAAFPANAVDFCLSEVGDEVVSRVLALFFHQPGEVGEELDHRRAPGFLGGLALFLILRVARANGPIGRFRTPKNP